MELWGGLFARQRQAAFTLNVGLLQWYRLIYAPGRVQLSGAAEFINGCSTLGNSAEDSLKTVTMGVRCHERTKHWFGIKVHRGTRV